MKFPGGRLAEIFGTKKVLGLATLASSVLTLLNPLSAKVHVFVLIVFRVAIGLVQGVLFPCINPMLVRYA